MWRTILAIIIAAILVLGAAPAPAIQAAAPRAAGVLPLQTQDLETEACTTVNGIQTCILAFYHQHDATLWTVTYMAAFIYSTNSIYGYSNLWRNVTTKACTGRSQVYSNYRYVVFYNAYNPSGAACGGARFVPAKTRFHTTWQNLLDTAHPIIYIPRLSS